jgi:hypothetical protein
MKKAALCFAVLAIFFSCGGNNWDDTIIENVSEFGVTFEFSNTGQIDLPAGGKTTFPTKTYQRLESYSPDKRVYFAYEATNEGYTGWFRNRQSWLVKVINDTGGKAALSDSGGWMDSIDDIPKGDQSNETDYQGQVYTDKPNFIVTETENNFPAVAVYNRDAGGAFNVTIRLSK